MPTYRVIRIEVLTSRKGKVSSKLFVGDYNLKMNGRLKKFIASSKLRKVDTSN